MEKEMSFGGLRLLRSLLPPDLELCWMEYVHFVSSHRTDRNENWKDIIKMMAREESSLSR